MDQTPSLDITPDEIPQLLEENGVAGAGGAGFPSHVKWQNHADVDYLMVNHQESEPNFYADKWLAKQHAETLGTFCENLLDTVFEAIVIGTKAKYRDTWVRELEAVTDADVYEPSQLPFSVEQAGDISIAYTPDIYTYSEERVLLMVTSGTEIGDDLPTDHGWIVHNTESLYNICQAVTNQSPVTHKYVHVDGDVPKHRCLKVPIGTPAKTLLAAADVDELDEEHLLADGGPGWCYPIDREPDEFGVRKRTNGLLVLEREVAEQHMESDGQIDILDMYEWEQGIHETSPTELAPERVRIPRITNEAYEGFVLPSEPVVSTGDTVHEGEVIARPADGGISNTQHASIDGTVTEVTETHIVVERS